MRWSAKSCWANTMGLRNYSTVRIWSLGDIYSVLAASFFFSCGVSCSFSVFAKAQATWQTATYSRPVTAKDHLDSLHHQNQPICHRHERVGCPQRRYHRPAWYCTTRASTIVHVSVFVFFAVLSLISHGHSRKLASATAAIVQPRSV